MRWALAPRFSHGATRRPPSPFSPPITSSSRSHSSRRSWRRVRRGRTAPGNAGHFRHRAQRPGHRIRLPGTRRTVRRRARRLRQFREKPDLETAQQYFAAGPDRFLWNSGMFVWRAGTLLDCIRRFAPQNHAGLLRIADAWDTASGQAVLDEVYPTLMKISVDFAVMEPASRDAAVAVVAIPMPLAVVGRGLVAFVCRDVPPRRAGQCGGGRAHAADGHAWHAGGVQRSVALDRHDRLRRSDDRPHARRHAGLPRATAPTPSRNCTNNWRRRARPRVVVEADAPPAPLVATDQTCSVCRAE